MIHWLGMQHPLAAPVTYQGHRIPLIHIYILRRYIHSREKVWRMGTADPDCIFSDLFPVEKTVPAVGYFHIPVSGFPVH